MADDLHLELQVYQFHLRRWVGHTVHALRNSLPADWQWMVEEVHQLINDLPVAGDKRLVALGRQLPSFQVKRAGSE